MVLPINTDTTIDAISRMSQANLADKQALYTEANTRLANTENQQKMAEYQEYISDTSKQLREARAQADISKANSDKLESDIITSHPDLVRQVYESGAYTKLASDMATRGADFNKTVVSVAGDGFKDADDYKAKYAKLITMNPDLVQGWPTVDQVMKDPSMLPRANLMVAAAWHNDSQFLQKQAEATQEQNAAMARTKTTVAGQLQANREDIASKEREGSLNRANELEKTNLLIKGRIDTATIRADAQRDSATIRANKQKGKKTEIKEVMPGGLPFLMNSIKSDLGTTTTNLNSASQAAFITDVADRAVNEWNQMNQMYFNGTISTPPDTPASIARRIMDDTLANNVDAGGNYLGYKTGEYHRPAVPNDPGRQAKIDKLLSESSPAAQAKFRALSPEQQEAVLKKQGI